jgi:hypothetical protein
MDEQPPTRLGLSAAQILGGGLAAASAAFVASYFGVAGTVLGAAVMSVVATVGTALYAHWAQRTANRLTQLAGPLLSRQELERMRRPRLPWRRIALGAAAAFTVGFAVVTVVELAAGRPLSSLLGRNDERGTTLVPRPPKPSAPVPAPTRSRSPSPSSTPAPTTTATTTPGAPSPSLAPTETPPAPTSPAPSSPPPTRTPSP